MATVLIPLPARDFDPTEAAVPWRMLTAAGHRVRIATPDGRPAEADPRMVHGTGLGPLAPLLKADANGRAAYAALAASPAFNQPLRHDEIGAGDFDALVLPGGHAPGMRPYLESSVLQALVAQALAERKPVGAICHGVVLAARARRADGRSVLHGRRTTALTRLLELSGWLLTAAWLGRYYRTYPQTVQQEVTAALAEPGHFVSGPPPLRRDAPDALDAGFALRDGMYLSARWPGDAHRFATEFIAMLA
jgi:protease I